ncbi:hypothetical protein EIN_006860 [Entamoeba invadens IP1]|uniref:Uncharacterized protein n=1 Tax=Entamoeba invadens IP1 TaxID=370355 RepID=L7FM43_ENTIV|nr:hypothetical protein EIN_006860 [Entamoeba invadens IP1]ELP88611.1 hypothetical protein EIN_006860 [Entamoeba invadens IP1]|eukprot:XP_004255382.1 hypothetical protein EIN_006860 [Entamoeba invadens IP1]
MEKTPGGIIFEPTDIVNGKGFISIGYVYITEMMLDQDFTHVQFDLEMEDTTDFELILADLVFKTDFVEFTNTSFVFVDKDLKTKYFKTDKKVSITAYYKPDRKEFSNGGSIKFLVTKGSAKSQTIHIHKEPAYGVNTVDQLVDCVEKALCVHSW